MRRLAVRTCPWCGIEGRGDEGVCPWCLRPLEVEGRRPGATVLRLLAPSLWASLRRLPAWAGFFALSAPVMVAVAIAADPSAPAIARAGLQWAVLGLLALACSYPLGKRRADLSVAGVAVFAAMVAAWAADTWAGWLIALAPFAGAAAGALVGLVVSGGQARTAVGTAAGGAALAWLVDYVSGGSQLAGGWVVDVMRQATIGPVPAMVIAFPALLLIGKVIAERPALWPVPDTLDEREQHERLSRSSVVLAFVVSGAYAGMAGLVRLCSATDLYAPLTSPQWIVLPLAAMIIGGGSLRTGRSGVAAALVGATWLASLQAICQALDMPFVEAAVILTVLWVAVGAPRLTEIRWIEAWRLVRGRFDVILPEEQVRRAGAALELARKLRFVGFAIVLFLAYSYVAAYVVIRAPEGYALVTNVTGSVDVYDPRVGNWKPVEIADTVGQNCWIRTGPHSSVELRLSDGSVVQLYSNTNFYIQRLEETATGALRRRFTLPIGELLAKVRKLPTEDSYFEVAAPTVVVGVRGTIFHMKVTPEWAEVTAIEGELRVEHTVEERDERGALVTAKRVEILPPAYKIFKRFRTQRASVGMVATGRATLEKAALTRAEREKWRKVRKWLRVKIGVVLPQSGGFWRGLLLLAILYVVFIILTQFDFEPPRRDEEQYIRERARFFEQWSAQRWRRRGRRRR